MALRAALREDPDVVLVGEMRDLETMEAALKLAETGHLTMATLHTNSAAQTITRIIDAFPGAPAGADPHAALARARRHRLSGADAEGERHGPRRGARDPRRHAGHPQPDPRRQDSPDLRNDAGRPGKARHADDEPVAGAAGGEARHHARRRARHVVAPRRADHDSRTRRGRGRARRAVPARRAPCADGTGGHDDDIRLGRTHAHRPDRQGRARGRVAGGARPTRSSASRSSSPRSAPAARKEERYRRVSGAQPRDLHAAVLGHDRRRPAARAVSRAAGQGRAGQAPGRRASTQVRGGRRGRLVAGRRDAEAAVRLRRALHQHGGRRRGGRYSRHDSASACRRSSRSRPSSCRRCGRR